MSSERKMRPRIERINKPTDVVLAIERLFPASFTHNEEVLRIISIQSIQTEVRKTWQGRVEKNIYMVRTEIGTFQLQHNLIKNSWTLVGKLREEKANP